MRFGDVNCLFTSNNDGALLLKDNMRIDIYDQKHGIFSSAYGCKNCLPALLGMKRRHRHSVNPQNINISLLNKYILKNKLYMKR